MRVTHIPCGPAANDSELKSFEHIKNRLQSEAGGEQWILLTNLAFSVNNQLQSDEIDLVAIGSTGVRVLEVKHWTAAWYDSHRNEAVVEAERVTRKAKTIGTTLQRIVSELPFVEGAFLLSQDASKVKRLTGTTAASARYSCWA